MPLLPLPYRHLSLGCFSAPPSTPTPTHCPSELEPVLRAVLDALPKPETSIGTAAGRRLRSDVEHHLKHLKHGDPVELRGFPSAAQADEWLERARFDLTINPDALYRLHYACRDFEKQWKAFELTPDQPLYRTFQTLSKEIEDAIRFPKRKRLGIRQLMAFDARLEDLKAQTRCRVDQRAVRNAAFVQSQQRANAVLRSARPPGARSPALG